MGETKGTLVFVKNASNMKQDSSSYKVSACGSTFPRREAQLMHRITLLPTRTINDLTDRTPILTEELEQ